MVLLNFLKIFIQQTKIYIFYNIFQSYIAYLLIFRFLSQPDSMITNQQESSKPQEYLQNDQNDQTVQKQQKEQENIQIDLQIVAPKINEHFQKAKCINNNQCLMICCNKDCQNHALLCGLKKCTCRNNHKLCLIVQYEGFIQKYESKAKHQNQLIQKTQQIFQKLIDQISQSRQRIIKNMKNIFLTSSDLSFLSKIVNQNFQNLKGKQLASIFIDLKIQSQILKEKEKIIKIIESLEQMGKDLTSSLNELQLNIKAQKSMKNQISNENVLFFNKLKIQKINSKILSSNQELKTIQQFFKPQKIHSIKLLFRASQNDFAISSFYQKCSNIPNTLIIAKTENNKIIGGYTHLQWKKYSNNSTQLSDPEKRSFIFSLTQKDKFILSNTQYATYYLQSSPGPRFGKNGYADFWICNKSNQSNLSYVFGSMAYKNEKYQNSKQSYQKFVGGPSQYFKTSQWEVFEVKFN